MSKAFRISSNCLRSSRSDFLNHKAQVDNLTANVCELPHSTGIGYRPETFHQQRTKAASRSVLDHGHHSLVSKGFLVDPVTGQRVINIPQQIVTDDSVCLHGLPLLQCQLTGLVENTQENADFTNVMQSGYCGDPGNILLSEQIGIVELY